MSIARVLVADTAASVALLRATLPPAIDLVGVGDMKAARLALQPPPALVICGCHFEEGGMYDLLRLMKATPELEAVPFVAIRCVAGELEDALYESVKIAVRALGGNAFVDFLRWQRRYGEAEAAHRLSQLVHRLLQEPHTDTG